MKNMKQMSVLVVLPIAFLGGCVTAQATAEERAWCQEMEQGMGTAQRHAHGRATGSSSMNLSHRRCRQILAQPE